MAGLLDGLFIQSLVDEPGRAVRTFGLLQSAIDHCVMAVTADGQAAGVAGLEAPIRSGLQQFAA